jgi:hypothetical protein
MSARLDNLERELANLRRRVMPGWEVCEEMRQEHVSAQARADVVAQAFGDVAPKALDGESPLQYRRRLVGMYQKYSPTWRTAELRNASEDVMRVAETQIYADAMREAHHPTSFKPGQLIERKHRDPAGRLISRFFGDPAAAWAPFMLEPKIVTGIGLRR